MTFHQCNTSTTKYPIILCGVAAFVNISLGIWEQWIITFISGLMHAMLAGVYSNGRTDVALSTATGVVSIGVAVHNISAQYYDLHMCTFIIGVGWLIFFAVDFGRQMSAITE